MKVYIIKASKVSSSFSEWFVWNVYSSKEKAIKVYKDLISLSDEYDKFGHKHDYIYSLNEYDVIE